MMRVVVDANIVVGATISPTGRPAQVRAAWESGQILLVISRSVLSEVERVLARPPLARKYNVTPERAARVAASLREYGLIVPGTAVRGAVHRHANDDHVISAAVESRADCIVTGDEHLLALGEYEGIPILTAQEFLDTLNG